MAHKYAQIAFTDTVRKVQTELNSRSGYASMDEGEDYNYLLSDYEAEFIEQRDSFYIASVGETGWPYVQHRGGPKGFMRVLDASTLGFSDYSGNRQYVSTGNFRTNNRVSLFFMDYPNRRRLKLMGRIEQVDPHDWDTLASLEVEHYRAEVERAFRIKIEAFDWNCPQHITPRFTEQEIEPLVAPVIEENKRLKAQSDQPIYPHRSELGDGPLALEVTGIRQLTPRVRAYELRNPDGTDLPRVEAGAHLQIPVHLVDDSLAYRHYSICSNPERRDIYEIAVLKEESGRGGSVSIHQSIGLGQLLHCQPPQNFFTLHEDQRPAVLIAGGIGITPIKAMAQQLLHRGVQFELHYSGRSQREMAFYDRLQREFKGQSFFYRSDQGERLALTELMRTLNRDCVIYACGPDSLLSAIQREALDAGVASEQLRFEQFSATKKNSDTPMTVELAKSGFSIEVEAEQTVLDAILESGVELAHSCRSGACKSCSVRVLQGEPDHRDHCLSSADKEEKGMFCPCVSRSRDDFLKLDI